VGIALLGGVANVMSDRWDNREPMAKVKCRTLIIHGAADEVGPGIFVMSDCLLIAHLLSVHPFDTGCMASTSYYALHHVKTHSTKR